MCWEYHILYIVSIYNTDQVYHRKFRINISFKSKCITVLLTNIELLNVVLLHFHSMFLPCHPALNLITYQCVFLTRAFSLKFIRCNRPPRLTMEDALEEVLQEMRDYHYIWSAHLQNCRWNKLYKEQLSFMCSVLLCNAKCMLFF